MKFIATLEHSPDNCWAREENEEKALELVPELENRAAEHDVELYGAYATPSEHTFYFVLGADTFEAVTGFLGPPILEDHEGHIAPVLTLGEAVDEVLEAEGTTD